MFASAEPTGEGRDDTAPAHPSRHAGAPRAGYAHAVVAAAGRLASTGRLRTTSKGVCRGACVVEQFEQAVANVLAALDAADAAPEHRVRSDLHHRPRRLPGGACQLGEVLARVRAPLPCNGRLRCSPARSDALVKLVCVATVQEAA